MSTMIRGMKRPPAIVSVAALVLLAGCAGDDGSGGAGAPAGVASGAPSSVAPSPAPSSSAPAPSGPSSAPAPEPTTSLVPFPADTALDAEKPSGGQLDLVSIRVAPQQGYDRVVFEFAGTGQPGWFVQYVDQTRADASGDPVPVKGQAFLELGISSIDMTKPGLNKIGDPALPTGLGVVRDVVSSVTFEAQYQAFIGTSKKVPFRVTRLADPPRVVVDVRYG